jgi:hypothetical protein
LVRSNFPFDTGVTSQNLEKTGAHERDRTADLVLTKDVLYQLSYVGHIHHRLERVMGIEPTLSAWKAEVLPLNYTRLFRKRSNLKAT